MIEWIRRVVSAKARGNVQFRPCFCCNDTQKWGKTKILGGYPKKEGMGPLASYP